MVRTAQADGVRRPIKAPPKVCTDLAEPIKALIESVRLSHGGGVAGDEQEHGTADLPAQGLAGMQAPDRSSAENRGFAIGGEVGERALVDRPVPVMGGPAQWADLGAEDQISHPRAAGLAVVTQRKGDDRGGGAGACFPCGLQAYLIAQGQSLISMPHVPEAPIKAAADMPKPIDRPGCHFSFGSDTAPPISISDQPRATPRPPPKENI